MKTKNKFLNKILLWGFAFCSVVFSGVSPTCTNTINQVQEKTINTNDFVKDIKNKNDSSSLNDNGMRHIYYGDDLSTFPNNVADFGASYSKGSTWNYNICKNLISNDMTYNNSYTFNSNYTFSFVCSDLLYSNYSGYCKFNFGYSYYGNNDISSGVNSDNGNDYYEIPLAKQFIIYMGIYHYENSIKYFDILLYARPTSLVLNEINFNFDCYVPVNSSYDYYCFLGSGNTYNNTDYSTAFDLVCYDYLGDNVNQETFNTNEDLFNDTVSDYRTQISNFSNISSLSNAYCNFYIFNTYSSVTTTILNINVPFYDIFTFDNHSYYLSCNNIISYIKLNYNLDLSSYSVNSGVSSSFIITTYFYNLNLSTSSPFSFVSSNFCSTLDMTNSTNTSTAPTLSSNTLVSITSGKKLTYANVFTTTDFKKYNSVNNLLFKNLSCGSVSNAYYDLGYNDAISESSKTINDLNNTINDLNDTVTNQGSKINTLNNTITSLQNSLNDSVNSNFSLSSLVYSVMNIPFMIFQNGLNVEFMGINLWGLLSGVLCAMFIIFILKKIF